MDCGDSRAKTWQDEAKQSNATQRKQTSKQACMPSFSFPFCLPLLSPLVSLFFPFPFPFPLSQVRGPSQARKQARRRAAGKPTNKRLGGGASTQPDGGPHIVAFLTTSYFERRHTRTAYSHCVSQYVRQQEQLSQAKAGFRNILYIILCRCYIMFRR